MLYYTVFALILCNAFFCKFALRVESGVLFSIILLLVFSALRVDAGYDYPSYVLMIEKGWYFIHFEPLPALFAYISDVYGNPQIFFAISATITFIGLYFLFKTYRVSAAVIILYISLPFCFIDSLSLVRQYLAMGLCCLFIVSWPHSKLLSFILFFLAIGSHYSSLVFFLVFSLYIFSKNQLDKYGLIVPIVLAFMPFVFSSLFFGSLGFYDGYADSSSNVGFKGFMIWSLILLSVMLVLFISKNLRSMCCSLDKMAFFLFVLGYGIYAAGIPMGYHVARIYIYFAPFGVIVADRCFRYAMGYYRYVIIAAIFSFVLLFGFLEGARNNVEYDFLNQYKFYPSKCETCG